MNNFFPKLKKQNINYNFILFISFLAIVFFSKFNVLNIPFYWDETGWIGGTDWLYHHNFFRVIPGLYPPATYFGHPPGLHFSLAALFKLFGESIWLSHLFIVCFSFIGVYFTYLLGSYLFGKPVGVFSALLLFFSPIYFAQSAMYLGDLPVAAIGVMCIYLAVKKNYVPFLISSICLVFIKESGIFIVLAFIIYLYIIERRNTKNIYIEILKYSIPLWLIGGFLLLQKFITGKFTGIYLYDWGIVKHNPIEFFSDFVVTLKWIFIYQYRFIFSIIIILNLLLNRKSFLKKEFLLFILIFIIAALPFSYFILLPRYLLPVFPFLCIATVWSLFELVKSKKLQIVFSLVILIIFVLNLKDRQTGNDEMNMRYVNHIKMYKSICNYIENNFADSKILTVFPYNAYLRNPFFGCVSHPLNPISNNKATQVNKYKLILFDDPPTGKNDLMLKEYVNKNKMILIKEIGTQKITSKLYARN